MPPLIKVDQLSKKYEGKQDSAVKHISFSLEEGQVLSLTGESGSGKTTLLQLIAGLIEPDEGKIYLDGEWVKGPSRRLVPGHPDIKMVFQHYNLSPNLRVRQNIAHILKAYVADYREERTDELLKVCKLGALADRFPRELSGGEKQRVALARAIAEEPRLLLMDEPFSNIDISLKNHLKEEIIEILEELKITAIIVTHEPQDALSMAKKVAVMHHGNLLQLDSPQAIYRKPANAYVANLFGRCNFLNSANSKALLKNTHTLQQCLRAENIHLQKPASGKPTALVKQIRFMGAYQEVKVEINDQFLLLHHKKNHLKIGDQVSLRAEPDMAISFSEN